MARVSRIVTSFVCLVSLFGPVVSPAEAVVSSEEDSRGPTGQQAPFDTQGRLIAPPTVESLAVAISPTDRYVPGQLIVKYRDSVTQCVHCLLKMRRSGVLQQATSDRSARFEQLHAQHRVISARPIFRTERAEAGLRARGGVVFAQALAEQEQARVAAIRTRFARRAARSRGVPPPDLSQVYLLELPKDTDVLKAAEEFARDPHVAYAHPNYKAEVLAEPNDPSYGELWGLQKIQASSAWDEFTDPIAGPGQGVLVGVIDTGIDYTHPDLAQNIWTNPGEIAGDGVDNDNNGFVDDVHGYDFASNDGDPKDGHSHGTHVAGTIAAVGHNALGVVGVAPNATLLAAKGLSDGGSGSLDWLASAIQYAVDRGADVLNNSWGCRGGCPSDPEHPTVTEDAVAYAHSLGTVVVFAAGNDGRDVADYSPASQPEPITVSATTEEDMRATFSNYGPRIDVGAPGVGILSTVPADGYQSFSGTSMACPHVVGTVALILSIQPTLTNEDVRDVLSLSADDVGVLGSDEDTGAGRINALKAAQLAKQYIPGQTPRILRLGRVGKADSTGNPNGFMEPGETLDLTISLINGQALLTGVSATLISQDPLVNVLSGTVTYGDFETPRTPKNGTFHVALSSSITPGTTIRLRLAVTAVDYATELPMSLGTVLSPQRTGWPVLLSAGGIIQAAAAVEDLDRDGEQDVIIAPDYSTIHKAYRFRPDGRLAEGAWPVSLFGGSDDQALADLDRDGRLDIILNSYQGGRLYALKPDGASLPNWPIDIPEGGVQGPAVADVDGDGIPEIAANAYTPFGGWFNKPGAAAIYLLSPSGQSKPGWPVRFPTLTWEVASLGFLPEVIGYSTAWLSDGMTIGDLDRDGKAELVVATSRDMPGVTREGSDESILYAFHSTGTVMNGWPRMILGTVYQPPVIADLEGDGSPEVLVHVQGVPAYPSIRILAFRADGRSVEGWPNTISARGSPPVVGDLDADGDLELVVPQNLWADPTRTRVIGVYDHRGRELASATMPESGLAGSPVLGDVDGDGTIEIVSSNARGNEVWAWHADGTSVAGWPKIAPPDGTMGRLTLSDLDLDGRADLLGSGVWNGRLNAWALEGLTTPSAVEWPTSRFGMARTGFYSKPRVVQVNQAPYFRPPVRTEYLHEGRRSILRLRAIDPERQPVTYTAVDLPPGATFDATQKTMTWTPSLTQSGVYRDAHFLVSDGQAEVGTGATFVVFDREEPFHIVPPGAKTIMQGQQLRFFVTAVDRSRRPVSLSMPGLLPFGVRLHPVASGPGWAVAVFRWTPLPRESRRNRAGQVGDYTLEVQASAGASTRTATIPVRVTPLSTPPELRIDGSSHAFEGFPTEIYVKATDEEFDDMTLEIENLPAGAQWKVDVDQPGEIRGRLTWTPRFDQAGTYPLKFIATDLYAKAEEIYPLEVIDQPLVTLPGPQTTSEGVQLAFSVFGADGDSVTFSAEPMPIRATFVPLGDVNFSCDQNGAASSCAADIGDALLIGRHVSGLATLTAKQLAVADVNADGTVTMADVTMLQEIEVGLQPPLNTFRFVWRPDYRQAGSYPITFRVSDGSFEDAEALNVSVQDAVPPPPEIVVVVPAIGSTVNRVQPIAVSGTATADIGVTITTMTVRVEDRSVSPPRVVFSQPLTVTPGRVVNWSTTLPANLALWHRLRVEILATTDPSGTTEGRAAFIIKASGQIIAAP
ncbi:MAG: S8 family serine peptidase [Candidatus Omnitrophica bacterium]|nr:S8 family serine peptidase [Candidatus Omnitrophota bacterium]